MNIENIKLGFNLNRCFETITSRNENDGEELKRLSNIAYNRKRYHVYLSHPRLKLARGESPRLLIFVPF